MKSNVFLGFSKEISQFFREGKVGVIPTDTIYGLCASAFDKKAVEKVYSLKKRSFGKPFIILISSISELELFGIELSEKEEDFIQKVWPGKVSVIFPCQKNEFEYLHRGKNSLAFRVPAKEKLRNFLSKSGPLIAPSANFEGEKVSRRIGAAQKYFKDQVDFYVNGGLLFSRPSTLVQMKNGQVVFLRLGAWEKMVRKIFKDKK